MKKIFVACAIVLIGASAFAKEATSVIKFGAEQMSLCESMSDIRKEQTNNLMGF